MYLKYFIIMRLIHYKPTFRKNVFIKVRLPVDDQNFINGKTIQLYGTCNNYTISLRI